MLGFPFQEANLASKGESWSWSTPEAQLELEVSKAQQLAEVEVKKFKQMTGPGAQHHQGPGCGGAGDAGESGGGVQVWACVDVCACAGVSWHHVWNQEDRARNTSTSREMSGTDRGGGEN